MKYGLINNIKREAGDVGGNGVGDAPKPQADKPAGEGFDGLPESWKKYIQDLRSESAENRTKRKALEDAQAETDRKRQADEQKLLAEQGNWKTLAEQRAAELEAANKKAALADEFLADITASNTARVAKLSDAAKKLVPEGMEPRSLAKWLDAAAEVLTKPEAPGLDGGKTGDRNKSPVDPAQFGTKINF